MVFEADERRASNNSSSSRVEKHTECMNRMGTREEERPGTKGLNSFFFLPSFSPARSPFYIPRKKKKKYSCMWVKYV